jgi:hypothetical protein
MSQPGQKCAPDPALLKRVAAEHNANMLSIFLAQAEQNPDSAVLATPTGEARNALTIANIFLTHAKDVLAGRPTPTGLDDLTQQVATERYNASMQRAAESRTSTKETPQP